MINLVKDTRTLVGILDILVSNAVNANAKNIHIDVEDQGEHYKISVEDNGKGLNPDKRDSLCRTLNRPRRQEIEEYYGGLASEDSLDSGLQLIGMMVDSAEITSEPGKGTKIVVTRRKSKKRQR